MKMLISTFFLLCVLSGCQWGTSPTAKDKWIEVESPVIEDFTLEKMGHDAALKDIEQGKLRLELWGPLLTTPLKFDQLLQTRFSIEVGRDHADAKERFWDYLDAYNNVMVEEITKRYGDYVIEKALKDARK